MCFSSLGVGESIADIRELYQAKQAAAKTKRMVFDETKHRDEVDTSTQIRSYPMAASTSPERRVKEPPPIIKKGTLIQLDFKSKNFFYF